MDKICLKQKLNAETADLVIWNMLSITDWVFNKKRRFIYMETKLWK